MQHLVGRAITTCVTLYVCVVNAHGYLSQIAVGNKIYWGANANWDTISKEKLHETAAWTAFNQEQGFVDSGSYQNHAITCHKGGSPGITSIPLEAGSQMVLKWDTWPKTHRGPVLSYLAKCPGSCTNVHSSNLEFFKIDSHGLHEAASSAYPAGLWASDKLISQSFSWTTTIPSNIKKGNYVLRHEIIALHSAFSLNRAQNYPMCVNLEVLSDGRIDPCEAGADCRKGTDLYRADEPGVLIDIYNDLSNYTIPGPAVWPGLTITPSATISLDTTTIATARAQQTHFGQCKGLDWTGPTDCPMGTTCQYQDEYYWQCL